MTYRPDIDGIRAIAIFAVVLFHLRVLHFSGGYIGVDVFYVLSGYLVTGQILTRIREDRFALGDFFSGRVRRLFPALFATVAATFVASAWLLLPGDFERFAQSAIAALASVSNFLFYSEAGYWDHQSDLKPLLHTWSLGVEEQFYVLWPIALILLWRWGALRRPALVFAVVTFAGLILSEWMVRTDPSAAFYLFPFRIFQFSAGALAYVIVTQHADAPRWFEHSVARWGLFGFGVAVIVVCCVTYKGSTPFPGVYALPPTLATMALLFAGAGPTPFLGNRLLSLPPAVWFGKVSYALYLVHWPIISLYLYSHGSHSALPVEDQIALFAGMLVAAAVLHYGVEARFYKRSVATPDQAGAPNRTLIGLAMSGVLIVGASASAISSQGWPGRFDNLNLSEEDIQRGTQERFNYLSSACLLVEQNQSPNCHLDRDKQVLVLGNSLELDAYNFLRSGYAKRDDINLMSFGSFRTCEPGSVRDGDVWRAKRPDCQAQLDELFRSPLSQQLTHLVLATTFPFEQRNRPYLELASHLKERNPELEVILFSPYLLMRRECAYFATLGQPERCVAASNVARVGYGDDPLSQPLARAFADLGFTTIDRISSLCPGAVPDSCAHSTPDGTPVYYDTRHYSLPFARWSGQVYAEAHPQLFDEVDQQSLATLAMSEAER